MLYELLYPSLFIYYCFAMCW